MEPESTTPAAGRTEPARAAPCGCGVETERTAPGTPDDGRGGGPDGGERRAAGVDPDRKQRTLNRLRRIEGQVRGLQRMVGEDRYCADVLTQLSSVQEALRAVGRELMRNHLEHCATEAIRSGDDEEAEEMYDELVELMYKHLR